MLQVQGKAVQDRGEWPNRASLDAIRLTSALPVGLRRGLRMFDTVDSTQRVLLEGPQSWPDRALVVSMHQTAGRGRRGRAWQTPPGAALAISMLAKNPSGRRWAPAVSLALGMAAAEALQQIGVEQVRLKWPNDLMRDGHKLGGILLESFPGGVVAGIGINLALPPDARRLIGQPCVDLEEAGCSVAPEDIVAALARSWDEAFDTFAAQGFDAFRPRWPACDALVSRPVRLLLGAGESLDGIARGVDAHGCLLVESQGRTRHFSSAEVSVRTI